MTADEWMRLAGRLAEAGRRIERLEQRVAEEAELREPLLTVGERLAMLEETDGLFLTGARPRG